MIKTFKLFVFLTTLFLISTPVLAAPFLGDLTISASRVPDWYLPPDPPDTSSWTVVPVHAVDCADNGTDDGAQLRAAVTGTSNPANRILLLDASCTYNFNTQTLDLQKSNLVIRGRGMGSTILKFMGSHESWPCGDMGGGQSNINICGSGNMGSNVNWTSGYTVGTTVLGVANTSTFPVGTWVRTYACYDPTYGVGYTYGGGMPCYAIPMGSRNYFIAKVTARSIASGAGTITLDRGLIEDSSSTYEQQVVRPLSLIEQVGVEDMTVTVEDYTNTGHNYKTLLRFQQTAYSWAVRVELKDYYNVAVDFSQGARNQFSHGKVGHGYYHPYNESSLTFGGGAIHNAAIDNIFTQNWVIMKNQGGSQGNVFAYNWGRRLAGQDEMVACDVPSHSPGNSENGGERGTMSHGEATAGLWEGNDIDCALEQDQWWGPQLPRNTFYRNRAGTGANVQYATNRVTSPNFGLVQENASSDAPTSFDSNYMLNVTTLFRNRLYPIQFDYANYGSGVRGMNVWIERNLVEGIMSLAPRADTHNVSNVTSANTTQGVGDWGSKNFPASLVYTSKPSWWLSAPWPATGADVDVIGGVMHKLPAQCRYEGSTTGDCAPAGGGGGGTVTDTPPTFSSFSISPTTVSVNSSVTFSASVSDDHGVAGVQFYVGTTPQGNEVTVGNAGTYTFSYSPTVSGSYTITARVRDTTNQTTNSNPVTLTVNSVITPPVTPPSGCTTSTTLWQNIPFTSQSTPFTAEFDVTPTQAGLDAITGLSATAASAYTDLAILIRFGGGSGQYIEARNGIPYSATNPMTYSIGSTYHFRVVVNPTSSPTPVAKSFTVYVRPPGGTEQLLASNFAFRDSQSTASSFSNLSVISEPIGHQVCNFTVTTNSQTGGLSSLTFLFTTDTNLSLSGKAITIAILPQGSTKTTPALETQTPTASYQGSTNQITLPTTGRTSGSYDVQIKAPSTLSRKQTFTLASNQTFTLTNKLISGDINNDNAINALDWSMMSPDWFQTGRPSDINGDGITNALDFTWLNRNWFLIGE